jgi:TonB family protein
LIDCDNAGVEPFPQQELEGRQQEGVINSIAEDLVDCEIDLFISNDSGDVVSAPWNNRVPLASGVKTWPDLPMSLLQAAMNSIAVDVADCEIDLCISNDPEDIVSEQWSNRVPSATKTWSSLALVLFLHSALACLLWCSPKPQVQSHKWMEVQLVSMKGDGNAAGLSLGSPLEVQSGAKINAGEKINHETPPLESKSLPSEKRDDVQQNALLKKHAKAVPPQHKEQKAAAQLHPVYTDSPSQSVTASEGSGQIAGAGAGAAVWSSAGLPGGSGVDGGSKGTVERAFGAPDGPSFLHRVEPSYPAFAKRLAKQGTVLLRVTIDERGRPAEVEILQRAGCGLDEEAVRAVKQSTFVPAKRDGKPLTCKALLPIRFVLKES